MYSALANYYDTLMKDFDYDSYEKFLTSVIPCGKGLDLACGSGEMTLRLKRRGYDVTGADFSPEMLNSAVKKAKKARYNVNFVLSDLNNLTIEKTYDFVTSVCDGFNYVESVAKLKQAFKEVYNCLKTGGIFIFDVSTEYKLKNVIGNNLFYEDDDKLTYFWQNTLKKNGVLMELTFFEKVGETYVRRDEREMQYFYSDDVIFGALRDAGFSFETFNGKFEKYGANDSRLVVSAVK